MLILDVDLVTKVMKAIKVKPNIDTQGSQAYYKGKSLIVDIWLQQQIQAAKFASEEEMALGEGLRIVRVKPAHQTHCTMVVWGLPFCTPDSLVEEMVNFYGGKLVSPTGVMEKYRDGPFRGQFNGVRRFKVDMTSQVQPMGTYHLLDDTRIKVHYPGNLNTCARCHQFPSGCPGRSCPL